MNASDFNTVLPEVALAVYAMITLLLGVYGGKDALVKTITYN